VRVAAWTSSSWYNEVLELLLRMLGITHTRNTKVGSASVRGVSGGAGQEFPRGLELEGEEERLSDREGGGVDVVFLVVDDS
jgi:hypothetical protein